MNAISRRNRTPSLAALLLALSAPAFAQVSPVPPLMNFQARLAKPDGTPVPDGTYTVTLSLWDVATGGSVMTDQLWAETETVTVHNGSFAAVLGNTTALTDSIFNSAVYLEIQVGADDPLTPRQQLVTVAHAFKADVALSVPDSSIFDSNIVSVDFSKITNFPTGTGGGWNLTGNAGLDPAVNFLGTTDNQPLVFMVNGRRVMRYDYAETNVFRSINTLGGSAINSISAGVVGATIAGGGKEVINGTSLPNSVAGSFGTISGGFGNSVSDASGTIGGGASNKAAGGATVAGGGGNNAGGDGAFIGGGSTNMALGNNAAIGGGYLNKANGGDAIVGGGYSNNASGDYATIAGGTGNKASGVRSAIGGGESNIANNSYATVAGGVGNTASSYGAVSGGIGNNAGFNAAVGGGYANIAGGNNAAIGGGNSNAANGANATVPGGYANNASGISSFAAGTYANANYDGSFVWADYTATYNPFYASGANTFNVRAAGGFVLEESGNASLYTASTAGEKNRYVQLLNSPQSPSASGLKAGGILCADNFGYANPGKNDLIVKGSVGIGYNFAATNYALAVNGGIYSTVGYTTSDARFKRNIQPIDSALDTILALRGVTYDWDKAKWPERKFSDGTQFGFIAQELENILPELVSADAQGYKAVNYIGVVPVLTEAVKTLNAKLDDKQKQIDAAIKENAELKARLARLEAAVAKMQDARK